MQKDTHIIIIHQQKNKNKFQTKFNKKKNLVIFKNIELIKKRKKKNFKSFIKK